MHEGDEAPLEPPSCLILLCLLPTVRGIRALYCFLKAPWLTTFSLFQLLVDRDEVDRLRKRFMKLDKVRRQNSSPPFPRTYEYNY